MQARPVSDARTWSIKQQCCHAHALTRCVCLVYLFVCTLLVQQVWIPRVLPRCCQPPTQQYCPYHPSLDTPCLACCANNSSSSSSRNTTILAGPPAPAAAPAYTLPTLLLPPAATKPSSPAARLLRRRQRWLVLVQGLSCRQRSLGLPLLRLTLPGCS